MAAIIELNENQAQWAARAHLCFLLNITFLPVIAFVVFLHWYVKAQQQDSIIRFHFKQSLIAQLVALILMLGVSIGILGFANWQSVYTWMSLIIYLTCIHSLFILLALYAWSRTANRKHFSYPLLKFFMFPSAQKPEEAKENQINLAPSNHSPNQQDH